jgi:diacylglycerol kinase (ATP)
MNPTDDVNPQKARRGLSRVWHAFGFSIQGLKAGWYETAFRQEVWLAMVMLPAAFYVGQNWVEVALLVGSVFLVMIVELLNTGIESAIDRFGGAWNELSKRAKDLASAAVLLALLLCIGIWTSAIWHRFFT